MVTFEPNTPYNDAALGINRSNHEVPQIGTSNEMETIMHRNTRLLSLAALITLTIAGVATAGAEPPATATAIGNDTCCFSNPSYSGTCEVTTGPDESCSDVVAYLNNQMSVGKTYCENTKIRGGWTQVECEGDASMCAPVSPAQTTPAE
jgi:hypothetical protein